MPCPHHGPSRRSEEINQEPQSQSSPTVTRSLASPSRPAPASGESQPPKMDRRHRQERGTSHNLNPPLPHDPIRSPFGLSPTCEPRDAFLGAPAPTDCSALEVVEVRAEAASVPSNSGRSVERAASRTECDEHVPASRRERNLTGGHDRSGRCRMHRHSLRSVRVIPYSPRSEVVGATSLPAH